MLPAAGTYHFPWEINSVSVPEGKTLRTFGRLHSYDMTSSKATITAQHTSVQHCIQVCTKFVEPFQAHIGSLYLVLGETEYGQGKSICVFSFYGTRNNLEWLPKLVPLNFLDFISQPALPMVKDSWKTKY
ncbi:CST complex subunit TEN1 [Sceloporus undulatus]|uniref:CST complex subunit TEN1 n=1 Tax=Sceloporus undulatus TaxID=8520 RepID=UPI001C4B4149|nr:CST complex subunit TEN1 [Sceloporus undulatus]